MGFHVFGPDRSFSGFRMRAVLSAVVLVSASVATRGSATTTAATPPVATPTITTTPAMTTVGTQPSPWELSSSTRHTCAVIGGGVQCWGWNINGQLGDDTITTRLTPVDVVGLTSGVVAVASGDRHTCALTSAGGVKCWGGNSAGQLGDGTIDEHHTPIDVSGLTSGVIAISAGWYHTCAVLSGGGAQCWGNNDNGRLGDGTTTERHSPVAVSGLSGAVALAAAGSHTCALTSGGSVQCWGYNAEGQLGNSTTTESHTPVAVTGLTSGVTAVAAETAHTCVVTTDGAAKCWGSNATGQLGDGTTEDRTAPVAVTGLGSSVASVAPGYDHTCAVLTDGSVRCWGNNTVGQIGDGTTIQRLTPVSVPGLGGARVAASGYRYTCVLANGLVCWGFNGDGELGDGTTFDRTTPVAVSGLSGLLLPSLLSSSASHTCALVNGGVKCWGKNGSGQLGDNTVTTRLTPVDVVGLTSGVVAVAAGDRHTCALTSAGGVKCWGANEKGQLGDGTTTQRHTPADVSGLTSGVVAVSAGQRHVCAVMSTGEVQCWGYNGDGQLGDNTASDRHLPGPVHNISTAVAVAAGRPHTCALTSGGGVMCWGYNGDGALGDGTNTQRYEPVPVIGMASGVIAVATGERHTCAVTSAGGAKCWGYNPAGQVGDGTILNQSTPLDVIGLTSGVAAVVPGVDHTCAVLTFGGVKCWGANNAGQIGDGTTMQRLMPVSVVGLSGVQAATAGFQHTCVLATGFRCWGYNAKGELGDGTVSDHSVPVGVSGLSSPLLVTQPSNQTASAPSLVTFGVVADSNPAPSYQWQLSTNSGSTFTNLVEGAPYTNTKSVALTVATSPSKNGYLFRVVVTNPFDSVTSTAATLTVSSTATINVTSIADSGAGTLRNAVASAASGSVISMASLSGAITLTSGEILINKNLLIEGPGAGALTISGNTTSRIFLVTNATLTLSGVTLANGRAKGGAGGTGPSSGGGGGAGLGGAIFVDALAGLSLANVYFTGNQAQGGAGGLRSWGPGGGGGGGGTAGTGGAGDAVSGGTGGSSGNLGGAAGSAGTLSVGPGAGGPGAGGGGGAGNYDGGTGGYGGGGGGGGGAYSGVHGHGGSGGYGGGGGGAVSAAGPAGDFGGDGANQSLMGPGNGGGGAGLGGAVFVRAGGAFTQSGSVFSGGSVTGGSAGPGASPGRAFGSDVFADHIVCSTPGGPVVAGVAYSTTCAAAWGTGYTWTVSAGTLPEGLSSQASGGMFTISGTPTKTGWFDYTVQAAGANGVIGGKAFKGFIDFTPLPAFATALDLLMNATLKKYDIPGAALAVAYNGKLIYAGGFGLGDTEAGLPVQPNSLFRIHSISKVLTQWATAKAIVDGHFGLDDAAFPYLEPTFDLAPGATKAEWLDDITVRHLLDHRAGWKGQSDIVPSLRPAADAFDVDSPPPAKEVIRYRMGQDLDYQPGTDSEYVGIDYSTLARLIETTAANPGESFAQYFSRTIMQPLGAPLTGLASSFLWSRRPAEVKHYVGTNSLATNPLCDSIWDIYPGPKLVQYECQSAMATGDAAGGFASTMPELVRLMSALAGDLGPGLNPVPVFPAGYLWHQPASGGDGAYAGSESRLMGVSVPGGGMMYAAFSINTSANDRSLPPGVAWNPLGDISDGLNAEVQSNPTLPTTDLFPTILTSAAPVYSGNIDASSCQTITGWAADSSRLNQSLVVNLWDNGVKIASLTANQFRPDVGASLGDNGLHGFSYPVPAILRDGATHTVHVIYESTFAEIFGAPVALTCPPNPPVMTQHPVSQTATAGQTVTFAAAASALLAPAWQWQVSTDGGTTFTDLSDAGPYGGTTTATLNVVAAPALHGFRYRAVATNGDGSATSTAATLTMVSSAGAALATGTFHTCAVVNGGVQCWGNNAHGQLGNPTFTNQPNPTVVTGLPSGVVAVTAGDRHTCALTSAGGVLCWGKNDFGQLGNGTTVSSAQPVGVNFLSSGVVAIAAGLLHTCALSDSGGVYCWGNNQLGELGNGSTNGALSPVKTASSSNAAAIAAGNSHSCALLMSGGVQCWGWGAFGQLGDGLWFDHLTPAPVLGLSSGVVALAVGWDHSCALVSGGTLKCWGRNDYGQLGDGTYNTAPTPVTSASGVVAIGAGGLHTCAVLTTTAAQCWGWNGGGQLGDGTQMDRNLPTAVIGLTNAVAIDGGFQHSCALLATGGVLCWGQNASGQIGDGSTATRLTPVPVNIITTPAPGPFGKISPANGAALEPWRVGLTWGGSAGAQTYEYCIDGINNNACDANWVSVGSATSIGLTGLTASVPYYWHVRAIGVGGTTYADGSATAFRSFTTTRRSPLVDLNGDGSGDAFLYNPVTGYWARQISQGGGGFGQQSESGWSPQWSVFRADFNSDAMSDVFLHNAGTGLWFKLINDGTGFTTESSGYWWPGWQKFVMDLNGDGLTDLFLYDGVTGQWYKAVTVPGGFTYATGYWTPGWDITVVNLNGDAYDDLFLINRTTGQWYWVYGEAGDAFTYPQAGYWAPDWALYPGDFNGDGKGDLFLYRPNQGQYYVALNNGAGYDYTAGYGWAPGWTPYVGDFDGDARDDLFLYSATTGVWFEMISNGTGGFSVGGNQTWTTGWQLYPTDLNDDRRTDILLYDPASGFWYQARNLVTGAFSYSSGFWAPNLTIITRAPIR